MADVEAGHARRRGPALFQQVRGVPDTPHGDATDGVGQLQGRNGQRALADRDRDGLAGVPLLAEVADLPRARRHQAGSLVRQVDARLPAEADQFGVFGDLVDPEPVSHVVEVDVAGLHQPAVEAHGAVAAAQVALEVAAVEGGAARAMHREIRIDGAGFESRQRNDGLERRSRRQLRLDRPVEQRPLRVFDQRPPVAAADASGKLVRVEGRAADHGEHLAVSRIERHDGAAAALHG